jgi:hypothetical protein
VPPAFSAAPSLSTATLTSATAPRARPPRTWLVALLLATCAIIAAGTAAVLSSSNESSPFQNAREGAPVSERGGRLDVRSTPEGAAVFVDGEPTGLRTPVVLRGLAEGRKIVLRVDKAGFASQEREVEVVRGSVETHAFELLASDGLVRFAGAPPGARVFVDEVALTIEEGKPVSLSVGPHTLRVEAAGSLMFSGTVVIVAGEQTLRVDGGETSP